MELNGVGVVASRGASLCVVRAEGEGFVDCLED